MYTSVRSVMTAAALVATLGFATLPAQADNSVRVGVLTCNVASGWGLVFGSSKSLKCNYEGVGGAVERYSGDIEKYGIDIGYSGNGVMVWAVLAPTNSVAPGVLAGEYGGVTGSAAVGVGAGANVLLGGLDKSITLQPVSIQGMTGLNVAAGIAGLKLKAEK